VDIPQPEIIVRMPAPDVNVSQAQPQVEVIQPEPQVQVVQQEQPQVQVEPAQAEVLVQRAVGAEANVEVQSQGEPQVTFNRAEPQVTVNQAEGQPTVRVERTAEAEAAAPAADVQAVEVDPAEADPAEVAVEEPVATAAVAPAEEPTQMFPVSELMDREVYNLRGEQIGDIERILRDAEGQLYAVLGHGGFLGLGEKQVLVRMQDIAMADDRLVIPGLTDDQIRAIPEFDLDEAGTAYTELEENENADLGLYQG
ncbi:MAG TPA: PRC-barrel domain-containing protein, partial [Mesorhizobium sp.]|nr:PRC-barrel domain-containing protein [Mesorhizobium sp.]